MKVRDKLYELSDEFMYALNSVENGDATVDQVREIESIIDCMRLYALSLSSYGNEEIEGT